MSVGLNASQARSNSRQDLTIFNETQSLMVAIINSSERGAYEVTVSDGTTMTESTPVAVVTGTVQNPTIVGGEELIIQGETITLGTTGTNLNSIIADINDAAVSGVVASKSDGYLVLTITTSASTWQYTIGNGSANTALGLTQGTYSADNPESIIYCSVWMGTEVDRAMQTQMDEVIRHFRNLGYKIERVTNASTSKTFSWYIYW